MTRGGDRSEADPRHNTPKTAGKPPEARPRQGRGPLQECRVHGPADPLGSDFESPELWRPGVCVVRSPLDCATLLRQAQETNTG